jgi:hypothetical protein
MNSENVSQTNSDLSLGQAAVIAGIALFLMAILAPIANFSILQSLIVPEDAAKTVSNIMAMHGSFRLATCFFLLVALLDIIVAWALYIFLKPVNKSLSLLTAWLRLVYATCLVVLLINLIRVLQLIEGAPCLSAFSMDQLQAQVMLSLNAFNKGWEFILNLFGFHLLLLGILMLKAGTMRRILGGLLILAALGYLADGFGRMLIAHYDLSIALYTFAGEVILIFWLLIKGSRMKVTG